MKSTIQYISKTAHIAVLISLHNKLKKLKRTGSSTRKFFIFLFMCSFIVPSLSVAAQVESSVACNEELEPLSIVYGDNTLNCEILQATDLDRFEFCGSLGDEVRLNVLSAGNLLDPNVIIRDPIGTIVAQSSCNDSCSLTIDTVLQVNGCYTIFISDLATNNTGTYSLQLESIIPVPVTAVHVNYDEPVSDSIDPGTDVDFYTFNATAGTEVRLIVLSAANLMDPTVEIRDPNGDVIVNGVLDGATCNDSCSYSVDISPALSGTYSLVIYDRFTNNTGGYDLSLWCLTGQCDNGVPDPKGPAISYETPVADEISPEVDGDFFTFNGTVGTEIRLNVLSPANLMDPTVEIRDPNGDVIVNGVLDGATCNDSCSYSIDISPAFSGTYSLLIYDRFANNAGGYELSLWCLWGDCDSDADGIVDGDVRVSFDTPAVLAYGFPAVDTIAPALDGDTFVFGGTDGDLIQINVLSAANLMDPTIEIRDPNGEVIVNGVQDGATCNDSCSYTLELSLVLSGKYTLHIYDRFINNTGDYEIGLQCLLGACVDTVAFCGDNCVDVANGPLIPDPGGNIQLDTDGDGYGNRCDPDLDNNGVVQAADLALFKERFFTTDPDADFDGNGIVQAADLAILKRMFFQPPGPSCVAP